MCLEAELPIKRHADSVTDDTGRHVSNEHLQDADSVCCDSSSHTEADKSEVDLSDDEKQENSGNKERACPVCKDIFNNPAEYTLHLKKHTRGTECLVCNKVLSSPNSLDRHLLVHSGEKPFSCQHCGKAFTTNGNMNRHKRKRKHNGGRYAGKKGKKKIASGGISPPSLADPSDAGATMECGQCDSSGIHNVISSTSVPLASEKWELIVGMDCEKRRTCSHKTSRCAVQPDQKMFANQCRDCGGRCLRMSYHGASDEKKFFLCKVCERIFLSSRKLQIHEQSHKTPYEINFNERNESDKDDFLKSVGLMRAEKTECGNFDFQGFLEAKAKRELEIMKNNPVRDAKPNLQVDGGDSAVDAKEVVSLNSEAIPNMGSPYSPDRASPNAIQGPTSPAEEYAARNQFVAENELQCKECAEFFKTKKLLKIHKHRVHLQKSTFECPECSYVSTDKSTLNRHTRIHTGERPYMCVFCSRTFTTETNAKRHVRKKHNIVDKLKKHIMCITNDKSSNTNENTKCPYCKRDFGDSKILTQHKNSPECPGKPYICSECPMRFPTKNNCLRHMTHQHKMEKDRAKQTMIISKPDVQDQSESNQRLQKVEQILDTANDAAVTGSESSSLFEEPNNEVQNLANSIENLEKNMNISQPEIIDGISEAAPNISLRERRDIEISSYHLNSDNICQRPSSREVDALYSILSLSEEVPRQDTLRFSEEVLCLKGTLRFSEEAPCQKGTLKSSEEVPCQKNMLRSSEEVPCQKGTLRFLGVPCQKSTLRFSDEVPCQEEPLDLSMRAIDLSIKREIPTAKGVQAELRQNSSEKSSRFLPQRPIPLPAHASSMSKYSSIKDHLQNCQSSAQLGILGGNWQSDCIQNLSTNTKTYKQYRIVPNITNSFSNESLDSDDYEQNLVIAEDAISINSPNENGASPTISVKPCTSDDLASVSSVIDTANSQDISKFLNPATFTKASKTEYFISSTTKPHGIRNAVDNNGKRFPCPMCDSSFDTSSTLNRHLVTHTGEKKFKCSICGKGFGTKSNCKRHELTHSARNNKKPRLLNESQNSNSDSSNTDSMEIDVPNSSLNRNFDAKNGASVFHPMIDSRTKTLECHFCKTTYSSDEDLKSHVRELHPLEYTSAGFH